MHPTELAKLCKALGDPTRARIFQFLLDCSRPVALDDNATEVRRVEGPTVGEVCCHITGLDKVTSTTSFHLKELREAGLIAMEKRGKFMVCSIDQTTLQSLTGYFVEASSRETCCQGKPMIEPTLSSREDVQALVKKKYGEAALNVLAGNKGSCCSAGSDLSAESTTCCGDATPAEGCCGNTEDPITSNLYSELDAEQIPEEAILASLGCGNPTALAELKEGETVLDLGSGGGIDVLLSAKRVGSTGFAYGLDMTDEMLQLAEINKQKAGATNVQFIKGHIEDIPLADASVDVVISNCVINLSADKDRVIAEAFRVLKPGGRFAVSDVVVEGEIPEAIRKDMELYVGCVAGALEKSEYLEKLAGAGFEDPSIEPTRRYVFSQIEASWSQNGIGSLTEDEKAELDGRIMGAFIRAVKPI